MKPQWMARAAIAVAFALIGGAGGCGTCGTASNVGMSEAESAGQAMEDEMTDEMIRDSER